MRHSISFPTLLALLILLPLWLHAKPRKFVSSDGKTLEAEVVEATDSGVILRRTSDGKEFTLPVSRLSEADQTWIKEWRAKDAPVSHPLGWKRLRLHGKTPGMLFGHATILGDGMNSIRDGAEMYLPVGAWIKLSVTRSGQDMECLVRYDGSTDWHVDGDGRRILIRTRAAGEQRVAAVKYYGSEVVSTGDGTKPLTAKECAAAIASGAGVDTDPNVLGDLASLNAIPESLCLAVGSEGIAWKSVPAGVRALSILGGRQGKLNLNGIEGLTRLEHLEVKAGAVTGMESLTKLPKLELLAVHANVSPDQVAHLGTLKNLRHLCFHENSNSPYPADAFDCIGELARLESAWLGSHYAHDKRVNPDKAFRNCPNLTVYRLNQASINDKGAFLERLPNLTEVDLAGGLVPQERALKLMDSGHFKHVRSIKTPPHYPLRNLPSLQSLNTIVHPTLSNHFDKFESLPSLRVLTVNNVRDQDLPKLAKQPAFATVRSLTLSHSSAENLSGLRDMPSLERLELFFHAAAKADLSALASLKSLRAIGCARLGSLALPSGLEDLETHQATAIDFVAASPLSQLRRLHLEECAALTTIAPLGPCPELASLSLIGCPQLAETGGLDKGTKLARCIIQGCGRVPNRE